jgi:putative solute:sodium symporter small subunit
VRKNRVAGRNDTINNKGQERFMSDLTPEKAKAYWARTSSLMWVMLGIWFFFGFVVHLFAPQLNSIRIIGFPLGFYMAAQGSLIAFVVSLFWFASKQNAIDEEFGVAEDE